MGEILYGIRYERLGVRAGALLIAGAWLWLLCCGIAVAQDVEPRRWTPFPVGTNVLGLGYAYSEGDISFDPITRIDDADFRLHSVLASYVRTFGFSGKTARVEHDDCVLAEPGLVQKRQRDARVLAGTGRGLEHHMPMFSGGLDELGQGRINGKCHVAYITCATASSGK